MVLWVSQRTARIAGFGRAILLVLVALILAHDTIYAIHDNLDHTFSATVHDHAHHDGWWPAFTMTGILAAIALALTSGRTIAALNKRLDVVEGKVRRVSASAEDARPSRTARRAGAPVAATELPSYARELTRLWLILLPLVTVLYAVQENLEHLASQGRVLGLGAIVGEPTPLALPVLALIALAMAALGAVVRWRIAILRATIARRLREPRRRAADQAPAREWTRVGAIAPHRWIFSRLDAGRAPPLALPA